MEEKRDRFRVPVSDTFRKKSPFGQLLEHMCKVRECVDIIREGLIRYYSGDYSSFSEVAKTVSRLEHEADLRLAFRFEGVGRMVELTGLTERGAALVAGIDSSNDEVTP